MPRSPLTNADRHILLRISKAQEAEKLAKREAEAKAKELMLTAGAAERSETNRLVDEAVNRNGIMKSIVAELGLHTKDRQQVYNRLKEVPESVGVREALVDGMTVTQDANGNFLVELAGFEHVDLGASLTGFVEYNPEGDVVRQSPEFETDPLFAMKLWGLSEVQVQL